MVFDLDLLRSAIDVGDGSAVHYLVETAKVNVKNTPMGQRALRAVSHQGDPKATKALTAAGVNANDGALALAADHGNVECACILVTAGADVNQESDVIGFKTTPLMQAIVGNHGDMTNFLIARGANVNQTPSDSTKFSPLIQACRSGDLETVYVLLKASANINYADTRGDTALAWAVYNHHPDCVEALMAAGANPNTVGFKNQSPLELALEKNYVECLKALLKPRVSVSRDTASTCVKKNIVNPECMELLKQAGLV